VKAATARKQGRQAAFRLRVSTSLKRNPLAARRKRHPLAYATRCHSHGAEVCGTIRCRSNGFADVFAILIIQIAAIMPVGVSDGQLGACSMTFLFRLFCFGKPIVFQFHKRKLSFNRRSIVL
jgi:hypothetical protein